MRWRTFLLAGAAVSLAACAGQEGVSDDEAGSEQSPQECMDFHRYVTSGAVTAAELVEKCDVTAAAAELAIGGGNDVSPIADPPSSESPPPPPAAEGAYGSDPSLDRLQDLCAGGDTGACSDLFWDSPSDSEYESFAQERMDPTESLSGETLETVEAIAMQTTWNDMSLSEKVTVCDGYGLFGAEFAYRFFSADTTDPISFGSFEEFFDEAC